MEITTPKIMPQQNARNRERVNYGQLLSSRLRAFGLIPPPRPICFEHLVTEGRKISHNDSGIRWGARIEIWHVFFTTGAHQVVRKIDAERALVHKVLKYLDEIDNATEAQRAHIFVNNGIASLLSPYPELLQLCSAYDPDNFKDGLRRIAQLFALFNISTKGSAEGYATYFAKALCQRLQVVSVDQAWDFSISFLCSARKKLLENQCIFRIPVRRQDYELLDIDKDLVEIAAIGTSCIARQHKKDDLESASRLFGRWIAHMLLAQNVEMAHAFFAQLLYDLGKELSLRKSNESWEEFKKFLTNRSSSPWTLEGILLYSQFYYLFDDARLWQ